jgi:hypothetical protein
MLMLALRYDLYIYQFSAACFCLPAKHMVNPFATDVLAGTYQSVSIVC